MRIAAYVSSSTYVCTHFSLMHSHHHCGLDLINNFKWGLKISLGFGNTFATSFTTDFVGQTMCTSKTFYIFHLSEVTVFAKSVAISSRYSSNICYKLHISLFYFHFIYKFHDFFKKIFVLLLVLFITMNLESNNFLFSFVFKNSNCNIFILVKNFVF